jgi:hypothetical protein
VDGAAVAAAAKDVLVCVQRAALRCAALRCAATALIYIWMLIVLCFLLWALGTAQDAAVVAAAADAVEASRAAAAGMSRIKSEGARFFELPHLYVNTRANA